MASDGLHPGLEVEAPDGFMGRIVSNESHFRAGERYRDGEDVIRVYSVLDPGTGEVRRYDARSLHARSAADVPDSAATEHDDEATPDR